MKNSYRDQRGQTLVAVVMIMVIALSVGVSVSTRFVKSLRIVSRTDTSSRSIAVAEALIERLLNIDYSTLEDYVDFNSCGSVCTLQIVGADGVTANAAATLSYAGGNSEPYLVSLKTDETIESNLKSYPDGTDLDICWDSPSQGFLPSVSGVLVYGTDGNYQIDAFSYNSIGSIYGANGFTEATSKYGYTHCAGITGVSDMISIRAHSLYNEVEAYIVPQSGVNLPSQGILIASEGTVVDTTRKVEVVFSSPYLPLPFDYALYSKSEANPLSN